MKKIIVAEKQVNMIYGLMINEHIDREIFNLSKKMIFESLGVPNDVKMETISIMNIIKDNITNNKKLNDEIEIECFDGWKIIYNSNFYIDNNGFMNLNEKTILLSIKIDSNYKFDTNTISNILSHELMHIFQLKVGSNKIISNEKSSDMYNKMNYIFDMLKNNEMQPMVFLNYIIYYSFREEQEAYTVGGKEYFDNIELEHDMTNEEYIKILKNSPYHIVFLRLGRAQSILNNREFFSDIINNFLNIYKISYDELVKILNEEIKVFRYKFDRVICDFCDRNNISMRERMNFYY